MSDFSRANWSRASFDKSTEYANDVIMAHIGFSLSCLGGFPSI